MGVKYDVVFEILLRAHLSEKFDKIIDALSDGGLSSYGVPCHTQN